MFPLCDVVRKEASRLIASGQVREHEVIWRSGELMEQGVIPYGSDYCKSLAQEILAEIDSQLSEWM